MNKNALLVLRVGLAVTFLWIGALIFLNPSVWASLLHSWARVSILGSLRPLMMTIGVLTLAVGAALLIDLWVWVAALTGACMLLIALIVTRFTDISIRDIGLLGSMVALFLETVPSDVWQRMKRGLTRKA